MVVVTGGDELVVVWHTICPSVGVCWRHTMVTVVHSMENFVSLPFLCANLSMVQLYMHVELPILHTCL